MSLNDSKKGVNYHWIDDLSNTFTSVKESSSVGNLFIFKEPKKRLKMFPRGFPFSYPFYKSEKTIKTYSIPFPWIFNEHDYGMKGAHKFFQIEPEHEKVKKKLYHSQKTSNKALKYLKSNIPSW